MKGDWGFYSWKARNLQILAEGAEAVPCCGRERHGRGTCLPRSPNTSKREEKCHHKRRFSMLSDDALVAAKAVISVIGNEQIEPNDSEELRYDWSTA